MRDREAEARAELLQLERRFLDRLDPVVQVERLPPARMLALERRLDELLVVLPHARPDRAPPLGRGLDHGDVAKPRQRHVQRARDRRRREREHVDLQPQRAEQLLLGDAEPLLLVEDDEAEGLRNDVARQEPVRADEDVHLPFGEVGERLLLLRGGPQAGDHLDADGKLAEAFAEGVPVLLREHGGRDEHEGLLAVHGGGEGGPDRDLGLAEADVAADEPVHRVRRLEVGLDRFDRALLILGFAVRELGLEPLQPVAREVEGLAGRVLAARVESEQLAGQLVHALSRARLDQLPRTAAELRQRRCVCVGADVARDLADLLVRDVEPVVSLERELEVVARDFGDGAGLEAQELSDAVILVDDVVAGAKVGEGLERAAEVRGRSGRAFAKDLRVGEEDEPELTPDEAAPGRGDREEKLGVARELLSRLEQARVDPAQHVLRSQRLAAVREGDDDALARADEALKLFLGLGKSSRCDGGPLRLEGEGLARRKRLELRCAGERQVVALELLRPDALDLSRLPDEVGHAVERRDEIHGHGRRPVLVERRLDQVEPSFRRREDRRVLDRPERALREGRKRADAFDLVAEELDSQGLATGRGKDVDQAAANGELAAFLHALDTLVAGEREPFGQLLEARLVAALEAERRGPLIGRRQPLGDRFRGGADEPSSGKDVERPCPLADEVRRGLEPRSPADAAAREQARRSLSRGTSPRPRQRRVRPRRREAGRRAAARAPRGAPPERAEGSARRHAHASAEPRRRPGSARVRGARRRMCAVPAGP